VFEQHTTAQPFAMFTFSIPASARWQSSRRLLQHFALNVGGASYIVTIDYIWLYTLHEATIVSSMELLLDRRRHDVIQPEAGCLGNSKALAIFVAPKHRNRCSL
jgi:hypothetical protein